jgi:tetratricopeptide (TPR) repeat protein
VKTVKAAEAIFAKGMLDEAQMLYEQVLEHAPHHPQALLRIGEIAARKGGDPLSEEQSFEDTFVDREESNDEPPSVALGQSFDEAIKKPAPAAKSAAKPATKPAPAPKPAPAAKPAPPAKPAAAKPAAAAKPKPVPAPKVELGDESFDALLQSVDDDVRAPAAKAPAPAVDDAFDDLFAEEAGEDSVLGDPSDIDDVVSAVADELEDDIVADTDLGKSAKRKAGAGDSSTATDVSIESAELDGSASDDDDVIVVEPPKKPRAPEPIADAFDPASLADEDVLEAEEVAHDEDGFDLAAELDVAHPHSDEESAPDFADIFSAFKKGIEQQLSAEDAAAHYDLAIAYKEMGLLSDAVEALEKVQKAGPLGVEGISLLATCRLEMGQPEAAIGLLVKALGKAATNGEKIALRYDLALAFSAAGQREEALTAFQEVAKQDPSFREVQAQIEELSG